MGENADRPFHYCGQCEFSARTVAALHRHDTQVHTPRDKKQFACTCQGCGHLTTNKELLSRHILRRHPDDRSDHKPHACDQCDYKAMTKSEVHSHAHSHSKEKPLLCDFPSCNFRTKTKNRLDNHKKGHDPNQDKQKVYSCPVCGHRTRFQNNMKIHIRTHTEDKPYACEFLGCNLGCNYRTRESRNLQTHRRRHDPDSMLKCDFPGCKHQSAMRWMLEKHQETHNPERKRIFQCQLCPKAFALRSCLNQHIKGVHTKEQPVPCKICDSYFSSAPALRRHVIKDHALAASRIETILKKYKCSVCDYCTSHKANVFVHQKRTHSNVLRNFPCNNCEYRAKCKGDLKYHQPHCPGIPEMRLFECQSCQKKFLTGKDLRKHVKRMLVRPEGLHQCNQCEFVTRDAETLRAHLKLHGGEEHKELDLTNFQINETGLRCARNRQGGTTNPVMNAMTGSSTKKIFKCKFPGCNFSTIHHTNCKVHERRHRPEMKNIQCPMCPKRFFVKYALNIHIRSMHARERPFKCDLCEHSSTTATRMRQHKRGMHTGKPTVAKINGKKAKVVVPEDQLGVTQVYSCPFCDWTHAEYASIVRHTVAHRFIVVSLERMHVM